MPNPAVEAAGPQTEKFVVPMGRYFGYLVVAVGVALCIVAVVNEGSGGLGLVCFCLAFALVAWVVLIRPQVTANTNGLLMRNMLRDIFLPWSCIRSCRVAQTLQVGTRDRIYHGLGVSKSARQAARERRQQRRQVPIGPLTGSGRLEFAPRSELDDNLEANPSRQEHVVKNTFTHTERRIETLSQERAKATAGQSPKVAWDAAPIAALVVAAAAVAGGFFA